MKMWVEEANGGRYVFRIFELSDSLLKLDDCFAKDLGARLAFSIVVFATVRFLCTRALLASGLCTVAALIHN